MLEFRVYFLSSSVELISSLIPCALFSDLSLFIYLFIMALQTPRFRAFMITDTRNTLEMTPLDEWSARRTELYLTTHRTYKRQTKCHFVWFTMILHGFKLCPLLYVALILEQHWKSSCDLHNGSAHIFCVNHGYPSFCQTIGGIVSRSINHWVYVYTIILFRSMGYILCFMNLECVNFYPIFQIYCPISMKFDKGRIHSGHYIK
jgi:hypothetical protein